MSNKSFVGLPIKFGEYENWFYDQITGEITFSDGGIKKLICNYESVGSLSIKTNTWLWAWSNLHLEEKVRSEIGMVRDYGEKMHFENLTNPKWTADEHDSWEVTAIAAYLMQAKGAYRIPAKDGQLYSFVVFKQVRWADDTVS